MKQRWSAFRAAPPLLGAVLVLGLGGCGFQLRGLNQQASAWKVIALQCPNQESYFCDRLRDHLIQSGVTVIQPTPAHFSQGKTTADDTGDTEVSRPREPLLEIQRLDSGRRAVTLTADAGAAEYEVSRSVTFQMFETAGIIIPQTTLRQFQTYRFDATGILGKDKEEQQIRRDLDNVLAFQVVNRLAIESINLSSRTTTEAPVDAENVSAP